MRAGWLELLLRLHSRSFREERGDEVRRFVAGEEREARARGRRAFFRFVVGTSADLFLSAVRLRLRPVLPGAGGAGGRVRWAGGFAHDLRHAGRTLRGTPVASAAVVVTLALGIGLNAAVFSVVDAVLLRPLPYPEPDRLVQVVPEVTADGPARANLSGGDFRDIRERVTALEDAAAVTVIRQNLTGWGPPRQVPVGWASGNLPSLLGLETALGRPFGPDDPPGTLMLTHRTWTADFGADPAVVGRTVRLDGHPHTVVGVLAPGSVVRLPMLPEEAAVWKNPDSFWGNGDVWGSQGPNFGLFRVVGRLGAGADLAAARTQLAEVQADLRARYAEYDRAGLRLGVRPLDDELVAGVSGTLRLLAAAAAAVLLVACANVAGILLVRAQGRFRELALRRALGAGRGRVVSLVLAEGLLLALAGGAAGLALAAGGTGVLVRLAPHLPRADGIAVDHRVLLFGLAAAVLCTVLVAALPAWRASRTDPAAGLGSSRTVADGGSGARDLLVAGQIAVSLVLLVATGLLTNSLVRLASVEPGFEPEGLLTFAVSLPGTRYERDEAGRFLVRLEEAVRGMPGVEDAGVMWPTPLGSRWQSRYEAGEASGDGARWADYRVGTSGYFATLRISLREGRLLGEGDPRHSVVVSRAVAERAWPGETAVGRTVRANPWGGDDLQDFEVVGVVEDVRYADLREPPLGALYFDVRGWAWNDWEFDVVVRTAGPPTELVPAVRRLLAGMDPELPLADAETMSARVARSTAPERFALSLVGVFGAVAGLLAFLGVYGTVSYTVTARAREIGVRLALGSARSAVVARVVKRGMRVVAAGLALGGAGALAASRLLEGWLFGVEPTDPATWAAVAATLALLALVATLIPARRAASTDPARVLGTE